VAVLAERAPTSDEKQDIRFCTTADGVRIAFASAGKGPPLVKCANWLNHLEFDWQSPVWRHLMRELSSEFRLIRYDERATVFRLEGRRLLLRSPGARPGERGRCGGLDRFPLLGISQGCAVAIGYAVRHPERVRAWCCTAAMPRAGAHAPIPPRSRGAKQC
jgi:pimeloyl-ACP methyl ester carboxylesterase